MRQYKYWTAEEDEVLGRLYLKKNMAIKRIAKKMKRSQASIENRLNKLNIQKGKTQRWLKAEDDFLRENYAKCRLWYLAKRLGRSKEAISVRAGFLNLGMKYEKWTYEDNELLKRLYLIEKMTVKETAEIMGRTLSSVKNHLYRMSIKKRRKDALD